MAARKKLAQAKGVEPPPEMADFPDRLKRVMKKRKMKQPELSRRSGVSQTAISNACRGASLGGITAATVARLSQALRVSPGLLLLGEGDLIPIFVAASKAGSDQILELDEASDPLASEPPERDHDTKPKRKTRTRP